MGVRVIVKHENIDSMKNNLCKKRVRVVLIKVNYIYQKKVKIDINHLKTMDEDKDIHLLTHVFLQNLEEVMEDMIIREGDRISFFQGVL